MTSKKINLALFVFLTISFHLTTFASDKTKVKKTVPKVNRQIATSEPSVGAATRSNVYLVNRNDIQLGSLDELRSKLDKKINETYLRLGQ